MSQPTPYFQALQERISSLGGFMNAHLHLDRSGTYAETLQMLTDEICGDGSSLSLSKKHAIIPMVHASPMYAPESLRKRVLPFLEYMISAGTRRADTVVDVTTDRVGLSALDAMLDLKRELAGRLDLRLGAYSPLGFRDDEPERWSMLMQGFERADFLGLLPERDDIADYPEHIGFDECCRRGILLAHSANKDIHIHTDQANHAREDDSERVLELVRQLKLSPRPSGEPLIWLIHVISPSRYDATRFRKLADGLAEQHIGVICCPSAAISMRQLHPLHAPTGNSIARVLELLDAGVQVRIGSDNICDITSPMGTPDLMAELFVLANAVRFYDQGILAKLACGLTLDTAERSRLAHHLAEDQAAVSAAIARTGIR